MTTLKIECENGHITTTDNGLTWTCPECNTAIGRILERHKPQHDAPWHPSDDDPKWDDGDPTANY